MPLTLAIGELDADLTAIAALSPSNDDIIQRKAGAWTNRTLAQLLTDLGLVPGVDFPTSATVTLSSADILDLHNTPITLVAAPGAGKALLPWSVIHHFRYGSVMYDPDTPGNEPKVSIAPQETVHYDLLGRDVDADSWIPAPAGELSANTAITAIITGGGYYITGDSTLTITVWYTIEDVPA